MRFSVHCNLDKMANDFLIKGGLVLSKIDFLNINVFYYLEKKCDNIM